MIMTSWLSAVKAVRSTAMLGWSRLGQHFDSPRMNDGHIALLRQVRQQEPSWLDAV